LTHWSVKITPEISRQSYLPLLPLLSTRSGTAYCLLLHRSGCCAQPSVLLGLGEVCATTDKLLGLPVIPSVYQNHYFGPVVNQNMKVCCFYSVSIYIYRCIYNVCVCVCVSVSVCVCVCVFYVCDIHDIRKCIRKETAFLLL